MKPLTSEARPVASLSHGEITELFALFEKCYEAVSRDQFLADLSAKDDVLLLRDARGVIQGFSTQVCHELEAQGRPLRVLFSGDTIISPECWGTQELVRAWCRYAGTTKAEDPDSPLYWLLISKGHRTYLYLPLFFVKYLPSAMGVDPELVHLRDEIASRLFGADYKPHSGRLEFAESKGHLRPPLAEVPGAKDRHAHIAFFLEQNPRYTEGHELVCVAEISAENMRGLARKHLLQGMSGQGGGERGRLSGPPCVEPAVLS